MKTCCFCGLVLPLDAFGLRTEARDGLQSRCKACKQKYDNKYHEERNPEKKSTKGKSKRSRGYEIRLWIKEYKERTPCADCGLKFPACVMDFDHKRDKRFNIGDAVRMGLSLKSIQKEVAKCELVCANHHRIRTFLGVAQ